MTAAFITSNIARAGIAFGTSLVIARGLGVEGFGLWTLCTAWAGVLTVIFDCGFGVLLTRDASRADPALGRLVGAALTARLGLLVPAAVVFGATASWAAAGADAASALPPAALLAVAGAAYSCVAPVFQARPRPLVAVLSLEGLSALGQCAAAWWLIRAGAGVPGLLVMAAAAQAIQLLAVAAMWRSATWLPRVQAPSLQSVRADVRRALPFAAAGLVANAQLRVAPILLGALSGSAAVAAFGAAFRIGSLLRMVPQAAFGGALPVLSQHAGSAAGGRLRSQFDIALRWFSFAGAVGLAAGATPLVRLTYGEQFAGAVPALVWIALGLVPFVVNSGRKVVLYASNREGDAARWSAVALAIQTAACLVLIPPFGAAGAAAALALGEALVWVPLHRRVEAIELAGRPVGVMRESPLAG